MVAPCDKTKTAARALCSGILWAHPPPVAEARIRCSQRAFGIRVRQEHSSEAYVSSCSGGDTKVVATNIAETSTIDGANCERLRCSALHVVQWLSPVSEDFAHADTHAASGLKLHFGATSALAAPFFPKSPEIKP
eukprot:s702_g35.t1